MSRERVKPTSFAEMLRLSREYPCPECRGIRKPCTKCEGTRVDLDALAAALHPDKKEEKR